MKVGVSLAGGGIRGIAHVGVLKALEEKNIKVAAIAGTSAGSIIATLYAMGYSPYYIYLLFKRYARDIINIRSKPIINGITNFIRNNKIGIAGLSDGNEFEKMYDELAPKHMKLLMAYYEGKPISGIIPIMYGNKTWYLYGASSNEHRNLMPNYLLQWEMIRQAIQNGCDVYDFRGVSGVVVESHPQYGLYRFKKGFGAEFTEFIGEVYLPFKPLTYKLYKFAEKSFRTLRDWKRKIKEHKK